MFCSTQNCTHDGVSNKMEVVLACLTRGFYSFETTAYRRYTQMILLFLNDLLFAPRALASGWSICSEARAPWMDGEHMGPVGVLMHGVMQVLQSAPRMRLALR